MVADDYPIGVVPPGTYARGERSGMVWVLLCAGCAGFAPTTPEDYGGYLSGTCQGCARRTRELHKFRAYIDSQSGCNEDSCAGRHPMVHGDQAATPLPPLTPKSTHKED